MLYLIDLQIKIEKSFRWITLRWKIIVLFGLECNEKHNEKSELLKDWIEREKNEENVRFYYHASAIDAKCLFKDCFCLGITDGKLQLNKLT